MFYTSFEVLKSNFFQPKIIFHRLGISYRKKKYSPNKYKASSPQKICGQRYA